MNDISKLVEAFTIRFLWVLHATRLKSTPGLCPPACTEGHTYKWPCRNRITKKTFLKDKHAHYDNPVIGHVEQIVTDADGVKVGIKLTEEGYCSAKRAAGWGNVATSCTFPKGHEKFGVPHSWVPNV